MSSQFRSSVRNLERTAFNRRSENPGRSRDARREWELLRARGGLPNRVLIDATYTLGSSRRSGIERVVRNLVKHGMSLADGSQIPSSMLMSMHGQFYEIGSDEQSQLERILRTQSDILGCMPNLYHRCVNPLVDWSKSPKLKSWLLPEPGHMGLFKLPYRYWYRSTMKRLCKQADVIQPGEGDLLVLPDAYWTRKEIWPAVETARSRGAYAAAIVYDLIPLTHPHFVGQRRTRRFEEYLKNLATNADMILAISSTVRRELEATLPELMAGQPYCQNIVDFPLGAEFPAGSENSQTNVRDDVLDLFNGERGENPYLTVAAFDPRKNHRYLLDAFDLLWQRVGDQEQCPKLCLVGRVGSRCPEIIERIKHHPLLNRHLFAFHDLTDAELQYCYQQCRGVIFPSIVEGFGLPIVEAMWHRAPTMASDTAIHREVGGEHCRYFDLAAPASLTNMLIAHQNTPALAESTSSDLGSSELGSDLGSSDSATPGIAKPHSWQDSAEIFFGHCLQGFAASQSQPLARSA